VYGRKFKYIVLQTCYFRTCTSRLMDDDMIGAIFAIVLEKYRAALNLVAESQGDALQPSHLEAAMRKIWHQGGGSKG